MFNKLRQQNKKTPATEEKVSAYQAAATAWERDILKEAAKSKRIAWIFAGVFAVVALAEALAITKLAPMKEKIPYMLRVDNSTGIVDEMVTLYDDDEVRTNEQLKRYFIKKYLDARLGYHYQFAATDYNTAYYMSEKQLASDFKRDYLANNPVTKYGDSAVIDVNIKSLEFLKNNTAFIRILLSEKQKDRPTLKKTHWVIRMSYDYAKRLPQSIRDITPVGFIVTSFSMTPESYQ